MENTIRPRLAREVPSFLLVGPYDPHCGEYTFLAPPLGVWRLQGVLQDAGYRADVFDPNCCSEPVTEAFAKVLAERDWDVVGTSTTNMTLEFDLALAWQARRALPDTCLIAGGMEATFRPDLMFELGPFDLCGYGEGEKPLLEIGNRLRHGGDLRSIGGTAWLDDGELRSELQMALDPDELTEATFQTPYERMPYHLYWERLEQAYRVGELPVKADREARLAEIRSVRLNTLNYCPMNCTFCSSTNFLHAAQGGTAKLRRLTAEDTYAMVRRISSAYPDVRTIIFQDDIFVFRQDDRIVPLCESLIEGKTNGDLPSDLQFISTNRIDAMTPERLRVMRDAGFRVLGFGVESFSPRVLDEFNKGMIFRHIEPMLSEALRLGITPFLDLIMTSPRCSIGDLALNMREAYRWLMAGCETGMYPYVIPFSGAVMARDPELVSHTVSERRHVAGTTISWDQPAKILPVDPVVKDAILAIEARVEACLGVLESEVAHLPSRVRSLVWIACAAPVLTRLGETAPQEQMVLTQLRRRLPRLRTELADHLETLVRGGAPRPTLATARRGGA